LGHVNLLTIPYRLVNVDGSLFNQLIYMIILITLT